MSTPKLPWEPGWVPPTLDSAVSGMVGTIIGDATQVAGQVAGTVVSDATQAVESVIPSPTAVSSGTVPQVNIPSVSGAVTDITSVIENTAKSTASEAMSSMAGDLEQRAEAAVVKALEKVVSGPVNPPALDDFIHADARSRAFRTLLSGLALTVLAGIVSALGAASGLNWFDSHSWPVLITLVTSSVLTSLSAYVGRLIKEPASTAPITNLLSGSSVTR